MTDPTLQQLARVASIVSLLEKPWRIPQESNKEILAFSLGLGHFYVSCHYFLSLWGRPPKSHRVTLDDFGSLSELEALLTRRSWILSETSYRHLKRQQPQRDTKSHAPYTAIVCAIKQTHRASGYPCPLMTTSYGKRFTCAPMRDALLQMTWL